MPLPARRIACEPDTRGCPSCGKSVNMMDLNAHCLMRDETGEFRYGHATCGLNHHTETKKALREVWCATCNQPFKDNHMLVSGETPRCRDGREWVRAEPVGREDAA